MPQMLEGVLNQAHRESLEIVEFIFHIIDPDAEDGQEVVYLDEVQLQARQKAFFLERLKEAAEGTQYIFKPDAVDLKSKCLAMAENPENFIEISRQITQSFSGHHEGQMSGGVFVIASVRYLTSANNWQKLIFLIKMDKGSSFSYKYTEVNGKRIAVMSEIENALNETKAAIQKSALVDVSNIFAWDLLAFDRVKKPTIGEYFRGFLGVTERQQDSVLTKAAHAIVKKWAKRLDNEQMPEGEDALGYIGRALNYLTDHDSFDTEDYLNAVIRDENVERKALLSISLREELANAGVAGQTFTPKPNSLPGKDKKQVYQTAEGVIVTFQGDKDAAGLTIVDLGNDRKRIIIETGSITIK
ncbi:MAG: nucleoid-associated protein [Methylotenera sp.]|nr:nucleoid-associated protein [Methylotenera sp.]MDP2282325.1 nucleoid-associated protein [Methylotenera sp.]MDP3061429.1 nucleoid-associated protein [Methylotenera sp.]